MGLDDFDEHILDEGDWPRDGLGSPRKNDGLVSTHAVLLLLVSLCQQEALSFFHRDDLHVSSNLWMLLLSNVLTKKCRSQYIEARTWAA